MDCSACFRKKSHKNGNCRTANVPEWEEHQRLSSEKEVLGFFITGHPLEKYKEKLENFPKYHECQLHQPDGNGDRSR